MALTSTLTAVPLIPENSQATPGLFNRAYSQLSDNIGTVNQAGVAGTILSGSTWASIGLAANSNNSDYIRFVDSAAQRSTYRFGSNAGGTADGLNIWDESGATMIVSFSKQSIRFYQNVVGPVFDVGGALASTLNAGTFGTGADSKESRIQAAISAASIAGIARVYVPANMYPYSAASVSFAPTVQMVREGGDWGVYDVRAYGAYGNGLADDSAAFQGALNSGGHVWVPPSSTSYRVTLLLTLTAVGQGVYGDGILSKVVQAGTDANSSVFQANSLGDNKFEGIYAVPNPVTQSLNFGYGFVVNSSHSCTVRNCRVTGHKRGGIALINSNYCDVLDNWIKNSTVTSGVTQSQSGIDIYLSGACSYNIIRGNHCIDGSGMGIGVQTINPGDVSDHNVIQGNVIRSQHVYGIMLYILNATDSVQFTTVEGNKIDTITGNISQDDGQFAYGAGIYVQTAEHTIVSGNHVRNTNVHVPSNVGVPSAIAVSGVGNCVVTDNLIESPNYYGITCIQASAYSADGRGMIIANNSIRSGPNFGIYLQDCVGAIVEGNRVGGTNVGSAAGIYVLQSQQTQSVDFIITGNEVQNFGTGIQSGGTITRMTIADNIVRLNTSYGILNTASYINCHNNIVINGTGGNGIAIASQVSEGFVVGNFVSGGANGILNDNGGRAVVDGNIVRGTTNDYNSGVATSFYVVLSNSTKPDVTGTRWASNSNTTTINDLRNGVQNQVVTLRARAAFKVQNSASSINLQGGADFDMVSGDVLTLVKEMSGVWTELNRSTATYASANPFIATGSGKIFGSAGGGTSAAYFRMANTSGALDFGLTGSSGNALFTNDTAYSAVFGTQQAKSLHFATNSAVRATINSSGQFSLLQNALLSVRTLAASALTVSAAGTNVNTDEMGLTIGGASGASLFIHSGGTVYIFNSALSAKIT